MRADNPVSWRRPARGIRHRHPPPSRWAVRPSKPAPPPPSLRHSLAFSWKRSTVSGPGRGSQAPRLSHGAGLQALVRCVVVEESLRLEVESQPAVQADGDVGDMAKDVVGDGSVYGTDGLGPALNAVEKVAGVAGGAGELELEVIG